MRSSSIRCSPSPSPSAFRSSSSFGFCAPFDRSRRAWSLALLSAFLFSCISAASASDRPAAFSSWRCLVVLPLDLLLPFEATLGAIESCLDAWEAVSPSRNDPSRSPSSDALSLTDGVVLASAATFFGIFVLGCPFPLFVFAGVGSATAADERERPLRCSTGTATSSSSSSSSPTPSVSPSASSSPSPSIETSAVVSRWSAAALPFPFDFLIGT